jgi:hypothetical protein
MSHNKTIEQTFVSGVTILSPYNENQAKLLSTAVLKLIATTPQKKSL